MAALQVGKKNSSQSRWWKDPKMHMLEVFDHIQEKFHEQNSLTSYNDIARIELMMKNSVHSLENTLKLKGLI